MVGSSDSIACTNIMLNSAVAESLRIYADRLEKAENFEDALHEMIKKTIKDHKHIIFNGNGYDDEWIKEATEKRGLLNLRTAPDAIPHLLDDKNIKMLTSLKVFSESELRSRYEITLENYCKTVTIEANTMTVMTKTQILPAIESYSSSLAAAAVAKMAVIPDLALAYESATIRRLSDLTDQIALRVKSLEEALIPIGDAADIGTESALIRDTLIPRMNELRLAVDEAEVLTAKSYWPYPTYGEILFSVR